VLRAAAAGDVTLASDSRPADAAATRAAAAALAAAATAASGVTGPLSRADGRGEAARTVAGPLAVKP